MITRTGNNQFTDPEFATKHKHTSAHTNKHTYTQTHTCLHQSPWQPAAQVRVEKHVRQNKRTSQKGRCVRDQWKVSVYVAKWITILVNLITVKHVQQRLHTSIYWIWPGPEPGNSVLHTYIHTNKCTYVRMYAWTRVYIFTCLWRQRFQCFPWQSTQATIWPRFRMDWNRCRNMHLHHETGCIVTRTRYYSPS